MNLRPLPSLLLLALLAGCPPPQRPDNPPPSATGQPTGRAPTSPPSTAAPTSPTAAPSMTAATPAASGAPQPTAAAPEPTEYNFEDLDIPADPAKGAAPAGAPPRVGQLRGLYVAKNNGLERCYAEATKGAKTPTAYRVGTLASIKPSGEVASVTTTGDSPAALNTCVQAAIKGWSFPPGAQPYTAKRVLAFKPR